MRPLIAVLAVALLVGLLAFSQWMPRPDVASGVIQAHVVRLGSRVGGRIAEVRATEGDMVKADDVLVLLEPFDLLEREAQAQADLAAAEAQLRRLQAGFRKEEVAAAKAKRDQLAAQFAQAKTGPRPQEIAAAKAREEVAQAELKLAEENFARVSQLARQNSASREQLDRAVEERNAAAAMLVVRQQELALLEEGTRAEEIQAAQAKLAEAEEQLRLHEAGYRPEDVAAAQAQRDAAAAAVAVIRQQKEELAIRAPAAGVIEAIDVRPGDLVTAGAPVLSLLDTSELWLRAYVPSTDLDLTLGQMLPVSLDSFPDESFRGEVTFVAQEAEFTPSNAQTPEERAKRVYRIKVTLREGLDRIRPGMMGDVGLEAGEE